MDPIYRDTKNGCRKIKRERERESDKVTDKKENRGGLQ